MDNTLVGAYVKRPGVYRKRTVCGQLRLVIVDIKKNWVHIKTTHTFHMKAFSQQYCIAQ